MVGWWPSENFGVVRNPNPAVRTARLADPPIPYVAEKFLKTGGGSAHALPYTLGSMSHIRARGKPKFGFPMAPPHKAEVKNESAVRELNR